MVSSGNCKSLHKHFFYKNQAKNHKAQISKKNKNKLRILPASAFEN